MMIFKVEWLKLKSHRFFWISMGLHAILAFLLLHFVGEMNYMGERIEDGNRHTAQGNFGQMGLYQAPLIWENLCYLAGFLKFIPAFAAVYFLGNEFQYRTMRQNIIDGMSRGQFFLSKVSGAVFLSLISVVVVGVIILIINISHNDFGALSPFKGIEYLAALWVETLLFMALSLLITVLFRRSAMGIILTLLYYFLIENLIGFFIGSPAKEYLPAGPGRELIQQPFTRLLGMSQDLGVMEATSFPWEHFALALLYSALMFLLGYGMLKSRDL